MPRVLALEPSAGRPLGTLAGAQIVDEVLDGEVGVDRFFNPDRRVVVEVYLHEAIRRLRYVEIPFGTVIIIRFILNDEIDHAFVGSELPRVVFYFTGDQCFR